MKRYVDVDLCMDETLYKKLSYIAKTENRSMNEQVIYAIEQEIQKFEEQETQAERTDTQPED